jgi:signal transduction histidine kinase
MKRFSVSIRFKLFAQVGLILILAILAFLAINYWYLGDIYINNAKKNMTELADRISQLDFEREDFKAKVAEYESESGMIVNVYSPEGEFLYESSVVFSGTSGRLSVESREEMDDGSFFEIQKTQENNLQYIVYCKPFENGSEVELFSRKSLIDENVNVALQFMGFTSVVAVIVALLVIFIYSGRFTRPLIRMSEITRKMAKLDFSHKLKVKQRDEIGYLADSINDMSDSLDSALTDLNEKNQRLLDEVEQEKKLFEMRKSFVSNVSHELKTPISIIQGYSEGLKMMVPGDNPAAGEYCDIIMNETVKMNELVLQLLELSSLEAGSNQLNEESFSIFEFVDDYYRSSKIVLDEKQIDFKMNVDESLVGSGDRIKLNMVLNNYISNAVSHVSGDRIIRVDAVDTGEYIRLYVFNTGEHIRQEDIENIWHSFYRADKSRSRKEGRFGLGLSIVSAICNLHGTEFGVENVEGGVRFYFDIKKAD